MFLRAIIIFFVLFAGSNSLTFAQFPFQVEQQETQDAPDLSLDAIDWDALEVEYQSEDVERRPWHNKIDGSALLRQRKLEILHRENRGDKTPEFIDLIVHTSSPAALPELETLGFELSGEFNDLLTGSLPYMNLQDAAVLEGVRYIEVAPEFHLNHDLSIPDIRADRVHQGDGLVMPYTGEDVIIGIIDSGIDFTHPDFSTEDGTRIQYLVDLLDPDSNNSFNCPEEFTYPEHPDGVCHEWTAEDIDQNPDDVTQIDGQFGGGHGTHVAGTAAGGGQADPDMDGAAPESDIIVVNASRHPQGARNFRFDDILNGTRYIFNRADELGKPAVVNLSLGAFAGPRDGTTGVEEVLNSLTDNGRIIVSSSGNNGFTPTHTGADMSPRSRFIAPVVVDEGSDSVTLEAWHSTGTLSEFMIIGYQRDGDRVDVLGQTPWLRPGDEMDDEIEITKDGDTMGYLIADATVINANINGDSQFTAEIFSKQSDADLDNTQWVVIANSTIRGGRFDLWVNEGGFIHPERFDVGNVTQLIGEAQKSVTLPASGSDILSVGAHIARDRFTLPSEDCPIDLPPDVECTLTIPVPTDPLDPESTDNPVLGDLAFFSSTGPLRTGEPAVDITAPGYLVYSARSFDYEPVNEFDAARLRPGGDYIFNNGTSMAAPHVSGAIAMMLQHSPHLSVEDIRHIFSNTARQDNFTGSVPNDEFGQGKLDALAAMQYLEGGMAKIAETQAEQAERVELSNYPNPFNPVTTVSFTLPESESVTLKIYNSIGQLVERMVVDQEMEAGTHELEFDGSHLSSGMYLLRLETGDQQLTQPVTLVK